MDKQQQIFVPAVQQDVRDETLYHVCLWGSVIMFFMNTIFIYMLLIYIDDHDYSIITEVMSVVLTVLIAFGCFYSLSIIYTITMKEHAYNALKEVGLMISGIYLVSMTVISLIIMVKGEWTLFQLLLWESIFEYAVTIAVAYSFHNLYVQHTQTYFMVPTQAAPVQPVPQPMYYFYQA